MHCSIDVSCLVSSFIGQTSRQNVFSVIKLEAVGAAESRTLSVPSAVNTTVLVSSQLFFSKKKIKKKNAIVHITVHYQIKNPKQNTLYVHRKDKLKEVHCSYQLISLQLFVCAAANNTASSSRSAGRDLTISTKQRLFTASP